MLIVLIFSLYLMASGRMIYKCQRDWGTYYNETRPPLLRTLRCFGHFPTCFIEKTTFSNGSTLRKAGCNCPYFYFLRQGCKKNKENGTFACCCFETQCNRDRDDFEEYYGSQMEEKNHFHAYGWLEIIKRDNLRREREAL